MLTGQQAIMNTYFVLALTLVATAHGFTHGACLAAAPWQGPCRPAAARCIWCCSSEHRGLEKAFGGEHVCEGVATALSERSRPPEPLGTADRCCTVHRLEPASCHI